MNDAQYHALHRRIRLLEKREPPLAAEFIDTAATAGDDLRVIARGWDDGEHAFGPVRWSPAGGTLPQQGDEAVIVERDDGVWQVIAWWSANQTTAGIAQATIDALDARLDALEARPASAKGTGAAVWSSAVLSTPVTVPHGLGATPTAAFVQSRHVLFGYVVTARDSTNLTVQGFTTYNGAITAGPLTFDWFAVA